MNSYLKNGVLALSGKTDLHISALCDHGYLGCLRTVLVYLSSGTDRIDPGQLLEIVADKLLARGQDLMPTIAQQWKQEGREVGRIAGQIQLLQRLLGQTESTLDQLFVRSRDQLQGELDRLQVDLKQRGR